MAVDGRNSLGNRALAQDIQQDWPPLLLFVMWEASARHYCEMAILN